MRHLAFVVFVAACGRAPAPPPQPTIGAPATDEPRPPASTSTPIGDTQALHLAAGERGAAMVVPTTCSVVDSHMFSSTASDLRLHLNISACPEDGCPRSLVAYLDSPAARDSRKGGEVLTLREAGPDRALLVVRNPVLDLAAVVTSDADRQVVVSCSAQASHDDAVTQAIIDRCLTISLREARVASPGEDSRATFALHCR